jgi:hypothetical protein
VRRLKLVNPRHIPMLPTASISTGMSTDVRLAAQPRGKDTNRKMYPLNSPIPLHFAHPAHLTRGTEPLPTSEEAEQKSTTTWTTTTRRRKRRRRKWLISVLRGDPVEGLYPRNLRLKRRRGETSWRGIGKVLSISMPRSFVLFLSLSLFFFTL